MHRALSTATDKFGRCRYVLPTLIMPSRIWLCPPRYGSSSGYTAVVVVGLIRPVSQSYVALLLF